MGKAAQGLSPRLTIRTLQADNPAENAVHRRKNHLERNTEIGQTTMPI